MYSPVLKIPLDLKTGFFSTLNYSLELSERTLMLKSTSRDFEDFYIPFSEIENVSVFFDHRNEIEISLKEKTLVGMFKGNEDLEDLKLILKSFLGKRFSTF